MEFHENLSVQLRTLALAAGAAILQVYGRPVIDASAKADASPVTEADLAADAVIRAGLAAACPDIPVITEEDAASHHLDPGGRFLIVDPLDGTKEFVRRQGDFTVNIALVENGVPVRGVVYAPVRGRLFYTRPDGTAIEEVGPFGPTPGAQRVLRVATGDNAALRVVASKSHRDAATDAYIARYAVAECVSAGSSLKFCLVAAGEADLYPRIGPTMEWDTAAGDAVLRAAGGRVLDLGTGAALAYGKPGWRNGHFVALGAGVALR